MEKKIIHFETLGCRLNQDESEGAARSFAVNGFSTDMEAVSASTEIDRSVVLCIVNTCTVTGKAEQKARRIIRLLLEKYPESVVLVTGCYAEVDGKSIESICPDRIVILKGTRKFVLSAVAEAMAFGADFFQDSGLIRRDGLNDFVERLSLEVPPLSLDESSFSLKPDVSPRLHAPVKSPLVLDGFSLYTPVFEKHSRGSIKVQDGCNCACSFCRIHLARGKSISLDADEVVRRVREIEGSGVNEVVFTGVNLSQYSSRDGKGNVVNFPALLSMVLESTSSISLRISSFYPQSIDDALCDVLKDPRVQPFFHMSIQSGSDRILELMRRPHSVSHVVKSIELIRKAKENPFISCDIIAGFPGEGEDDFEMTKRLCTEQNFAWIHAFPFSPRPDTPAAVMKGQVPERIKAERVSWLTEKAVEGKVSYVESWKGRTVSAIVENSRSLRNSRESGVIHAVTENYLHVECRVPDSRIFAPGSKVSIRIDGVLAESIGSGRELDCTGTVVFP